VKFFENGISIGKLPHAVPARRGDLLRTDFSGTLLGDAAQGF
jgi:hypothetical protein